MIKFTATALIHSVSPVIEIPSKSGGQPFYKRELVLDDSWIKDGKTYLNYILIEFSGEKMQQLDAFFPGQQVSVDVILSGRENNGRYFNSLRGQSIALAQPQHASPSTMGQRPAPAVQGYPAQPQYPQAQGYPAQGAYPPAGGHPAQPAYPQQSTYPNQGYPQQPSPIPCIPQPGNPGSDGLPFR